MELIGKPLQKVSPKGILLHGVRGEIHTKVLLALHQIEMKERTVRRPNLPSH
jgi:hypothetical protein